MTLIIAGHDKRPCISNLLDSEPAKLEMVSTGLFFAADSTITSTGPGAHTLAKDYTKVHSRPIKIWVPHIVDGWISGYQQVKYQSGCVFALSGGTLFAQHVVNKLMEALTNLVFVYSFEESTSADPVFKIGSRLAALDPDQGFHKVPAEFDFEEFNNYGNFVHERALTTILKRSIDYTLNSLAKELLNFNNVHMFRTHYAFGFYSSVEDHHYLYQYTTNVRMIDEQEEFVIETKLIPEDEVAVLGMSERFLEPAQEMFSRHLAANLSPAQLMFGYLNFAIEQCKSEKPRPIDKPSYLYLFCKGTLQKVQVAK